MYVTVDYLKKAVFDTIYPVGSIYISVSDTLPAGFVGNWQKIADGRTLWTTSTKSELGAELQGILPEHNHKYKYSNWDTYGEHDPGSSNNGGDVQAYTGATVLGKDVTGISVGNTLRPPSIGVTMWIRQPD